MSDRKKWLAGLLAGAMLGSALPGNAGGLSVSAADSQFAGEEWYDQIGTVELNREPAHAYFVPYESSAKALQNEKSVLDTDEEESAYRVSLNGEWNFKFAQNPAAREKAARGAEAAAYVEDWDTSGWDTIPVPSSIQAMKDEDGDFKYEKPIYTNQTYPWANYESVTLGESVTAPTVRNSVGQYKRTFTVPQDWDGREVFVSFEGVESAFYLYINGQRAGYAEDSYTMDEFNITPYLQKGENTIAVEVYRWSTGSYLENQDFIRYSGIFRDVNLYSKDKVEIRDVFVKTDLDAEYRDAVLTLEASVRNLGQADAAGQNYTVSAELYESDASTKVWTEPMELAVTVPEAKDTIEERADDTGVVVSGSKDVENPKKWFADTPSLYLLLIELKDESGNVVETLCQRVGFREIGKADINTAGQEQMQINGKKIMFRGTNRHESDVDVGRALSREDIKEDLFLMKQFNVNAIRTSHYPNNPYTYALADEIGIYICDEVNAESHMGATQSSIPSGFPIWNTSVMDRTKNMVERDKNHPCVVIWSLGNEATYSTYTMDDNYCFYNATRWILKRDPSRLRKYERDNRYTKGDREHSMVDIYSSQYWSVDSVRGHVANTGNKSPYIQSEYAHAMGNGLGNFKEYWEIFREYPNAQGGFIWDWIDQAMRTKIENTAVRYIHDPNTGKRVSFGGSFQEGRNQTKSIEGAYIAEGSHTKTVNGNALTLDLWLKPADNFTNSRQTFLSRGDDEGYNLQINKDGKLEFFADGWREGYLETEVPDAFTDGAWHRLTATVSDRTYILYFDGKQIAQGQRDSASQAYDSASNTADIAVGTNASYTERVFNGSIDRVAVLKGALTAEEIAVTADSLEAVQDKLVYTLDFTEDMLETEELGFEDHTYFGYGGDWDETVTDNDFCANGLVFADRTPSPELYEVKKVHQEISFYDDGSAANGEVRIVNEFLNTNLNRYDVSWSLKKDNVVLGSGTLTEEQKDLAPLQEKVVALKNFPVVEAVDGSDYVLVLSVTLKEDQPWADSYGGKAGDEIAFEEFELSYENEKPRPAPDMADIGDLEVNETQETITVTGTTAREGGTSFEIVLDRTSGYISSYRLGGKALLEEGPVPDYYRAPVSNDPGFTGGMRNAAQNFTIDEEGIEVDRQQTFVSIHVPGTIQGLDSPNIIDYAIYGDGRIVVTNTFTPASNSAVGNIAKIGMKMTVAEGYENLTYYGNGPQENYSDRNSGTKLGIYKSTVTDQFEKKYVKPQENGNRTGVRWTALTDDEGMGIMVSSKEAMECSALHYRAEDLASYRHPYQVPKQQNTILTAALVQRGLGNASCGPAPLNQYLIQAGVTYSQTFSILPISEATEDQELMNRSKVDMESTMPLAGIRVNGREIAGFSEEQTTYRYEVLKGAVQKGKIPQVEPIRVSDGVEVTVTQAQTIPGVATITARSPFGVEKTYTVNLEMTDQIYVSDMDWETDKGGYFENTRDRCGCGAAMKVYEGGNEKEYEKGIGTHAPSEISVRIDGMGATRFLAQAGISACQESGNRANVNYVVKADGEEIFRQNDVRSGESVPVELDVEGVKVLTLITETNGEDSNDHALWADAKLTDATTADTTLVQHIVVRADMTILPTEGEAQAEAVILPADAANQDVIWTSSDETIVQVDETGHLTAGATGEAVITAVAADGSGVRGSLTIRVVEDSKLKEALEAEKKAKEEAEKAKEKLEELQKAADELKKAADEIRKAAEEEVRKAREELERAQADLEKMRAELEQAKKDAAAKEQPSVSVGRVTLKKVAKSGKGAITVTWKKVSGAEGYQIQCAGNRKFKKAVNKETARKNKIKVKKLRSGKRYYVRVRAYKKAADGTKIYGKYSRLKKITVK